METVRNLTAMNRHVTIARPMNNRRDRSTLIDESSHGTVAGWRVDVSIRHPYHWLGGELQNVLG